MNHWRWCNLNCSSTDHHGHHGYEHGHGHGYGHGHGHGHNQGPYWNHPGWYGHYNRPGYFGKPLFMCICISNMRKEEEKQSITIKSWYYLKKTT